jgi:two-component system chemotaxis response regulator CheV
MSKNEKNGIKIGSNEIELVDFRILKEVNGTTYEGIYGINVAKVREIIRMPKLTELPGVPSFIEGIFDLRGVVIPVVNLATWMGVQSPELVDKKVRVIIAEFNNILIGFVVHDAKRIRRINWKDIEPASFASVGGMGSMSPERNKITGVTRIENDSVLLILDLESVVEELGLSHPTSEMDELPEVEQFSGTVLLVDDSITARKAINNALSHMGFRVVEATDGEDALERLEDIYETFGEDGVKREFKLVVSDVEMPRMDGFHLASKIKNDKRFKGVPIIFNSSISGHFSEERGKDAGGDAYLVKFDPKEFYEQISKVVRENMNKN